jgi:hypothetical protein
LQNRLMHAHVHSRKHITMIHMRIHMTHFPIISRKSSNSDGVGGAVVGGNVFNVAFKVSLNMNVLFIDIILFRNHCINVIHLII